MKENHLPPLRDQPSVPCRKGVQYDEHDFNELTSLLSDPVLRDAIPKNIRSKRNQAVLWCVKELATLLNNRLTGHQASFHFSPGELEDLHKEVDRLKEVTERLTQAIENTTSKKSNWWEL